MHELGLQLDRLAALIQANFLVFAVLIAAWLALLALALVRGGARWRPTRPLAVFAGIVSALSSLFMAPKLLGMSFGAVADWGDWIALLGISLAAGLIAFGFAWPAVATALRERR